MYEGKVLPRYIFTEKVSASRDIRRLMEKRIRGGIARQTINGLGVNGGDRRVQGRPQA